MNHAILDLITARTVRIISSLDRGSGFFIAPGKILTCAHVVRNAIEEDQEISIEYFSKKGQKKEWCKTILNEVPLLSLESGSEEYPDIALLQIKELNNLSFKIPILDPVNSFADFQEFYAFGFQKKSRTSGEMIGQMISLNYDGEEQPDGDHRRIFENGKIMPGMSGAPLVDRNTGYLTGMIQKTRNANTNLGAYTLPNKMILQQLEQWEKDKKTDTNSILKSKQHVKKLNKEYKSILPSFPLLEKYKFNLLFLALILFLGLSWLFTHVGKFNDSKILAAAMVMMTLLGYTVTRGLGTQGQNESAKLSKGFWRFLIRPFPLIFSFILVAFCWLFVISVWVVGDKSDRDKEIDIKHQFMYPDGKHGQLNNNGTEKIFLFSFRLKDSVMIEPKGKGLKSFPLSRFRRNEFLYGSDFKIDPIVFLRIHPTYYRGDMINDYFLKISLGKRSPIFISGEKIDSASILIGNRLIDVSLDRENLWKQPAIMEELGPELQKIIIDKWKNYKHLKNIKLEDSMRVNISLRNKSDSSVVFQNIFRLTENEHDLFIDPEQMVANE